MSLRLYTIYRIILFTGFITMPVGSSILAQYTDYFESYTPGEPIFVNWWGSWDGTEATAILAIESTAFNGKVSGHVPANEDISGVLSLGNKTDGLWQLEMFFYIPTGSSASWNLQGEVPVSSGASIVGDFLFNHQGAEPGIGQITNTSQGNVSFQFPHDQWFRITLNFNFLDGTQAARWGVFVDGEPILDNGTPFTDLQGNYPQSLGGVNFVSTGIGESYLMDRFLFCDTSCLLGNTYPDQAINVQHSKKATGWRIETSQTMQVVRLYDLQGRLVSWLEVDNSDVIYSAAGLGKGLYVMELQFDHQTKRIKVVH